MKDKPTEKDSTAPAKAQSEILQVPWKHGSSTIPFVNDHLNMQKQATSCSSTLKLVQIMQEKGMLQETRSI
jgi:BlaI family transcriptional regulator, penicillinase repressor